MVTRVFGKVVENTYEVDRKLESAICNDKNDVELIYTDKPTIKVTPNVASWVELCSYDGEPRYNKENLLFSLYSHRMEFNISENETVTLEKEIFRADLNEIHLHTNKIVEAVDLNKDNAEFDYEIEVRAFNKVMIESNEALKAYCDLHKMSYEDTDCFKLFEVVFPNEILKIKNGKMVTMRSLWDNSIVTSDTVSTGLTFANSKSITYDRSIDEGIITCTATC